MLLLVSDHPTQQLLKQSNLQHLHDLFYSYILIEAETKIVNCKNYYENNNDKY